MTGGVLQAVDRRRTRRPAARRRDPALAPDIAEARVLRSVLMKPEHEAYVGTLHRELLRIARGLAV